MTKSTRWLLALVFLVALQARGTERFFTDIEATSFSGRFAVFATSPDNRTKGRPKAFQRDFKYTCKNTNSGKTLWTRDQPMSEPEPWGDDPTDLFSDEEEGAPCRIYVSDSGCTVIYTSWEDLVLVDLKGKDIAKVNILNDCLTKEEHEEYVSQTTGGPIWGDRSHWYFVTSDSREYFVIRPWWGRQLIIDLSTGAVMAPTKGLDEAMGKAERDYVRTVLKALLEGTLEKCDCCSESYEADFAAYLAGVLKVPEVVPALRMLESCTCSAYSSLGGAIDVPEGRISPFNYSAYTTRQSVHLALRRLGEQPGSFPCTSFKTEHDVYDQRKPYVRKPVQGTRAANAAKIKNGMSPEQMIDLMDCPDYIRSNEWHYDIGIEAPYTLIVSWTGERTIDAFKVVRPALWQEGKVRDHRR